MHISEYPSMCVSEMVFVRNNFSKCGILFSDPVLTSEVFWSMFTLQFLLELMQLFV